jgi:tRNA nucleotidyltransferase (CCA-adding enzyme)
MWPNFFDYFSKEENLPWIKEHLPEVFVLKGVPQPILYHPENDTFVHILLCLEQIKNSSERIQWAVLLHDLGKGVTEESLWPKHHGHEEAGVPLVKKVAIRFSLDNKTTVLSVMTSRYHLHVHKALELNYKTVSHLRDTFVKAFESFDLFEDFLTACEADSKGRLGFRDRAYPQKQFFLEVFRAVWDEEDHQVRCKVIKALKKKYC